MGELDTALNFCQRGLGVFREIGDRLGEVQTQVNIGDILAAKGDLKGALETYVAAQDLAKGTPFLDQIGKKIDTIKIQQDFLQMLGSLSLPMSDEQLNNSFKRFASGFAHFVDISEKENLENIKKFLSPRLVPDETVRLLFVVFYESAMYRKTRDESHKKNLEEARLKLDPDIRDLLDELVKEFDKSNNQ
jgi:hypothetical protein